jgi:hypothetical protein
MLSKFFEKSYLIVSIPGAPEIKSLPEEEKTKFFPFGSHMKSSAWVPLCSSMRFSLIFRKVSVLTQFLAVSVPKYVIISSPICCVGGLGKTPLIETTSVLPSLLASKKNGEFAYQSGGV